MGTYSWPLVAASYLVATVASFAALKVAARIALSRGHAVGWWLGLGGLSMGVGIWSMHFIGMLAFKLPIPQGYDLLLTAYSMLIAIGASCYALWLLSHRQLGHQRLAGGALILGGGIALMHYVGMSSMRMAPGIEYRPGWLVASIVVAVVAAGAALWIAYHLRADGGSRQGTRLLAAMVMGFAIAGMHYTGMAAARFPADSVCLAASEGGMRSEHLAVVVGVCSAVMLLAAIVVTMVDRRHEERSRRIANSLHGVNRQLTHMVMHDPLTGLPNRIQLEQALEFRVAESLELGSRFAVLFIDLDGFKGINDVHGHAAGDRLLVEVARNLRQSVQQPGIVARLGGDEFVVVGDVADVHDAIDLAREISSGLVAAVDFQSGSACISASIGIALYPDHGNNARDLLAHADVAMYHVKDAGRNGYSVFEPKMEAAPHARMGLIQDLRMASSRGELFLVYQPKLDVADGRLVGVEALLRWQHPTRGLLLPDAFIGLAEKYGVIIELGHWVLSEACRQLAQWRREGLDVASVAVNLSPLQFRSADLVETIHAILQREQLQPSDLVLEITESMALQDPEASLHILHGMVAMGIRISIDDFGTGHSSLDYLRRLPAHELKIDRTFVRDIRVGSRDAAIVEMLVGLGRNFGLAVVAEGVETSEQRDILLSLGCRCMQGYLTGYPVKADVLAKGLREGEIVALRPGVARAGA